MAMLGAAAGVLLVALATSLGWGLRGEWGHWWGAAVPGSFCGMGLWLAFGESVSLWQTLLFGAIMGVSLSLGGVLSYGKIVGYVKSEHDRSPAFGLLGLFLVGGLWGFFGGTALGLLTSPVGYGFTDLAIWGIASSIGAYLAYKLLVLGMDLHLSPPRSDAWAAVLGGALASTAYFALGPGDLVVLRTAYLGWLGFGGGFAVGGLIHRFCTRSGWNVDSWKFMEHSVGFWGGMALGVSVLLSGEPIAEMPISQSALLASSIVVLWLVPYMNINNNFEYWWERGWCGRRAFVIFQLGSLAALFLLGSYVSGLDFEGGTRGGPVFLGLMAAMTLMAIAKFGFSTSRTRKIVDAVFLLEFAACLVLLALV
jgi:hypothetical protein